MQTEEKPWGSLWARLGAWFVDSLIVGAVGALIGLVAFDALAGVGAEGRLIGLAISILYYGLLGSRLGGGQTLGLRLFRLRIVSLDGRLLSVGRACLRGGVLVLPFIFNGLLLTRASLASYLCGLFAAVAVGGVALAQICLVIFNRPSRRLLHDLIAQSAIVKAGREPIPASLPRNLRLAVAACLLIPLAAVLVLQTLFERARSQLEPAMAAVQALPEIMSAGVAENHFVLKTVGRPAVESDSLVVTARVRNWPADENAEARRIAEAAHAAYRLPPGETLTVVVVRGYDIGISSFWNKFRVNLPAAGSAGR